MAKAGTKAKRGKPKNRIEELVGILGALKAAIAVTKKQAAKRPSKGRAK